MSRENVVTMVEPQLFLLPLNAPWKDHFNHLVHQMWAGGIMFDANRLPISSVFYLGICFFRISERGKWSLKITLSKIKFNLLFKVWYWCQSILVNRELPDAAADPAFWVPDCVLGIWDDYCMHGILPRGQARNLQDIFSHVGFSSQGQKTIKDCWDKYFNVVFWVP